MTISKALNPKLRSFLLEVEKLGFSLCLVGGGSRDYFLSNTIAHDLDFEIRPIKTSINSAQSWSLELKVLHTYLFENNIPYTVLPYLITKVEFEGMSLEFSSPRLENPVKDSSSHHHFEAQLDPKISYEESFKRRDFTINAIGIELRLKDDDEIIIDPFNGLEDLKNSKLRNISDYFFLDSVRLLRLIRFSLKFETFTIDELLLKNLSQFNLKDLSNYHFKEEMFKSIPGLFVNRFNEYISAYQLAVPSEFDIFKRYKFSFEHKTKEDFLIFVFFQNEKDALLISKFFSMPEKKLRDLKAYVTAYNRLKTKEEKDYRMLMSCSTQEALGSAIFKDIKTLEEKKDWANYLNTDYQGSGLYFKWQDWEKTSVDVRELEKIEAPLRSFYKFYLALKKKFEDGNNKADTNS